MHEGFPVLLGAGLLVLLLFAFGYAGAKVKIPGVILYILLGIALGRFIGENELLHTASEIGIVLLFFLLGMEFPADRLVGIAKKVWKAGVLDVILNLLITVGICYVFGLDLLSAFLIGGTVYATSSSITAKLLESSRRMANRESEFMLALLIFEDLVAPVFVAILLGMTSGEDMGVLQFSILVGKIVLLAAGAIFIGRFVFRRLGTFIERINDEDTFVLLTVGIALAYGGLAIYLGLSEVLGAFLAGMMLSETKRSDDIEQNVLPIRDLLLPLFFLNFGTTVTFGGGIPMAGLLTMILIWSIIAKVAVGILGGRWYGLGKRGAFRAGLSLVSRGEFSVVIAGLAMGSMKVFAGIYILAAAFIGILFFQLAPRLTKAVYGEQKKEHRKVKVPG